MLKLLFQPAIGTQTAGLALRQTSVLSASGAGLSASVPTVSTGIDNNGLTVGVSNM